MRSNIFESIVGAFVILISVLFLFLGFSSMKFNNSDNYNISAFFNRIATRISSSGGSIATVSPQLKRVLKRSSTPGISFG